MSQQWYGAQPSQYMSSHSKRDSDLTSMLQQLAKDVQGFLSAAADATMNDGNFPHEEPSNIVDSTSSRTNSLLRALPWSLCDRDGSTLAEKGLKLLRM